MKWKMELNQENVVQWRKQHELVSEHMKAY
jgi:hypothetical protein